MNTVSKKVVHYHHGTQVIHDFGEHRVATLFPIDHPDSARVSNTKNIRTSFVLHYDAMSGTIETENTIYIPQRKEH